MSENTRENDELNSAIETILGEVERINSSHNMPCYRATIILDEVGDGCDPIRDLVELENVCPDGTEPVRNGSVIRCRPISTS